MATIKARYIPMNTKVHSARRLLIGVLFWGLGSRISFRRRRRSQNGLWSCRTGRGKLVAFIKAPNFKAHQFLHFIIFSKTGIFIPRNFHQKLLQVRGSFCGFEPLIKLNIVKLFQLSPNGLLQSLDCHCCVVGR